MTGNWGVAILLVTLVLKLLFYPLSEASGKTSAKMRALQPRIKNIQEQYKGDKEKQGRATMELYQREKVNPVGGCLPTLVTIPVFLAFYWVLQESVEMRQAPFALWLNDLSAPDPYFILPALMAAAMFIQQRLSPMSPDPVQGEGDDVHADCDVGAVCIFSVGPGAVLRHQYLAHGIAAMEHQSAHHVCRGAEDLTRATLCRV